MENFQESECKGTLAACSLCIYVGDCLRQHFDRGGARLPNCAIIHDLAVVDGVPISRVALEPLNVWIGT